MIRAIAGFLRTKPRLGRASLRLVPDIKRIIQVDWIGPFQIRLRRHRSMWLRNPFSLEGIVLGAFNRAVRPGDTVYDIGANIGLHTRVLCSRFTAGQVIAFEPMSENLELLQNNITLGGISGRVRLFPMALGDTDRQEELQIDDVMSGSAALTTVTGGLASQGRRQYGLPPRTEKVTVARLDTLFAREKLSPPKTMKIDVEGAEGMVLRGAGDLLRQFSPRLIIELHGIQAARDVFAQLDELKYACFGFLNRSGQQSYKRLAQADLDNLRDPYELHFMLASCDSADFDEPITIEKPLSP